MARTVVPLTDPKCEAARYNPAGTGNKLADGGGLFLLLKPSGSKSWRLKYNRPSGQEDTLVIGDYPAVPLKLARQKREEAKELLAQGIDPKQREREVAIERQQAGRDTFEAIAKEWMERQTDRAQATRDKNAWLLQFAFDEFGRRPIKDVTPPMVLAACQRLENQEKLETAHRLRSKCGQVFRYAVATHRLKSDPTRDLLGALKAPVVKHRAALTAPKQVGQLLRDIDRYSGTFEVKSALKLSPLVFIRPGELRAAKWADIDLEAGLWTYTPPKTRHQTQVEHVIPLPTQAVAILRDLQAQAGKSPFVFKSHGKEGHLSENALLAALRRMGYTKEQMTGHGFRAMARTILDEVLGYRIELIEQQLAHQVKDSLGRAYNRTKHLPERARMLQAWADYLDTLKDSESNVVPFRQPA